MLMLLVGKLIKGSENMTLLEGGGGGGGVGADGPGAACCLERELGFPSGCMVGLRRCAADVGGAVVVRGGCYKR